jgi:hypothetical protein
MCVFDGIVPGTEALEHLNGFDHSLSHNAWGPPETAVM